MNQHSFLPNSQNILRSMISGIMESYENPWDILAELAQNSMDAINQEKPTKGHLTLEINAVKNTISFTDNGAGIEPSQIEELFVPYGSNKRANPESIGEKGVGLKFVIFSTNKFSLTSHSNSGSFIVEVTGAADWLRADDDSEITFSSAKVKNDGNKRGVTIELTLQDNHDPLLELSKEQIKTLLLTKTAIGSTRHIWDQKENCDIKLTLINSNSKADEEEFECEYILPTACVKKFISIDEYIEWNAEGDKSDQQKRRKLKDAIIHNQGSVSKNNRDIKYWSCMTPSRSDWAHMAVNHNLLDEKEENDFNTEDHFYTHSSGVFLSTKHMPTGVRIDLRATGEAGYSDNFFIILEDPSLKFDIGRKGIPHRTAGVLRKIAQEEFKEYLKYKRFIRGEPETNYSQFEREDLFEEINSLAELNCQNTEFLKRPNKQEATIAAMFYEQMGKGEFTDFKPYISGYRDKYDLTGRYNNHNLVIEFKFDLAGLFSDFQIARKLFNEMNVVVVWEITENDRQKAKDRGIEINDIDSDERIFPKTQFYLELENVTPVEVLEIKKLIDAE